MTAKSIQVLGVGNAIVDVFARVDDSWLERMKVHKGIMQLIDTPRAQELYGAMGPAREISGGSAANTIAGTALLGARSAFIGKLRQDQLGDIFAHDIRAMGVRFETKRAPADHPLETARSFILITPDGERSMNTYLGAAGLLGEADMDERLLKDAEWLYLEGYLFDTEEHKAAYRKAVRVVKAAGGRVALSVSDPFCVERNRADFRELIHDGVDLLFANEHEAAALYGTSDLDGAVAAMRADVPMGALTIGPRGAVMTTPGQAIRCPAAPMRRVDATGAGDLFAAGVLYGLTHGADLASCGAMGCMAAGEAISHIGARPEQDLRALFMSAGLIG